MWITTRHEGFDDPRPTKRQPTTLPEGFLDTTTSACFRVGLLFQFIAVVTLIVSHFYFEGKYFFTYDLQFTDEAMRKNLVYRIVLAGSACLYLFGSMEILIFQALLSDDVSCARGYRAGSKLLGQAAFFDVLSGCIQMAVFYQLVIYPYSDGSFIANFREGNMTWVFNSSARVLHGVAMVLFGLSTFFLEIYHDEGTSDWHGVANLFLCGGAGVAEVLTLVTQQGSIAVGLTALAILFMLIWALAFEQEVNETCPALCECELTNDVEQEVEKFTRLTPNTMPRYQGYEMAPNA